MLKWFKVKVLNFFAALLSNSWLHGQRKTPFQFLPSAQPRCPPFLKFHTTRKSKFYFTLLLVILDESTFILHEKIGGDFVEKTSISSFRKIDLESYLKVPTVISTNENRWDCAWEGLRVASPLEYPPWERGIPDTRVNYYNSPHIHVTDILSRYGLNANNSLPLRLTISY